jgi:hypothetical protein
MNALVNRFPEIAAWLDRIHIHKDRFFMENLCQVIAQTSGFSLGIIAAVADEDTGQDGSPCNEMARRLASAKVPWLRRKQHLQNIG